MVNSIRKVIFSGSTKSQAAVHVFLVLCAYTIITTAYTGLLFDTQAMIIRFILGVAIVAIHVAAERAPISVNLAAFLSPLLVAAILILGSFIFNGDGLLFIYLSCIALISLTYFAAKGLAAYIVTVGAATVVLLFVFRVNLLGEDFSMIYNFISFIAAMGLNVLAYSFCIFCIRLLENAEAANKAKSAFLSTMSHEIRTPMNAILGITEIQLQNENLEANIKEALGKIYASGDLLLGIINDILDLSKIEAGKLELVTARYEIASLVSDTAQLNMMRIGSKPIEFELYVSEDLPAYLMGDELRVKQILNNLLSNAFKYTAEGTVTLSFTSEAIGGKDEEVTLIFSVSDTGQGMTEDQVSKLFDEYSRFNLEANRTTEGTGLGMSITRNLIRLMNGEILIESEPGKGSTFSVRLPQGRIGAEVLGSESAENLHQFRTSSRAQMKRVQITREHMPYGRVLIVDDVETNIYVAKGLMTPYGLKIDSADSGFAAVEKIKNGNVYDIVFMDHMMPKMDGVETTQKIRGLGYAHPIVALTANAVAGQAEIFLSNGFDDFISKPIDVRQLNVVLNKLIRDKQTPEVLEEAKRQAEEKKNEASEEPEQPAIDPEFAKIFVRDATRSLTVLEEIVGKQGEYSEDDVRTYVIHVHGMKSALANIGKIDLSAAALKLEHSGRDGNTDVIEAETPAFLSDLRAIVDEMSAQDEKTGGDEADDDLELLRASLLAIKQACEEYDENAADKVLKELKTAAWSKQTATLLDDISEHLLHSDFDEIVELIDKKE